jgi:hypothetical protein
MLKLTEMNRLKQREIVILSIFRNFNNTPSLGSVGLRWKMVTDKLIEWSLGLVY